MPRFRPHLVRRAREARGFKREELAVAIGKSYSAITKIEFGIFMPSATTLGLLAGALDVEVGDFYDAADDRDALVV